MFDIQSFRKDRKLTQLDVALKTGLDQAVISKYESGKARTNHVSDILFSHYPELKNYKFDEKEKFDPIQELILQQKELINNLTTLIKAHEQITESNLKQSSTIELLVLKKYYISDEQTSIAAEP